MDNAETDNLSAQAQEAQAARDGGARGVDTNLGDLAASVRRLESRLAEDFNLRSSRLGPASPQLGRLVVKAFKLGITRFSAVLFRILPIRWSFRMVVFGSRLEPALGQLMMLAFMPRARSALRATTVPRFSDAQMVRRTPLLAAAFLFELGAYQETLDAINASGIALRNYQGAFLLAKVLFELERFSEARDVLDGLDYPYPPSVDTSWEQFYGQLEVLSGHEKRGAELLRHAAGADPGILCPHQNLSARYSRGYSPTLYDREYGEDGLLYDAYNYIGQRVTHVGSGHLGVRCYSAALDKQAVLSARRFFPSAKLRRALDQHRISLDRLKILPWEWVTQIGHLGMLDVLLRMRDIGWWSGDAVVLAPTEKIANRVFLSLFEREAHVFIPDINIDGEVAAELFSMQRSHGMGFNAWRFPNGKVVPWQEAGAVAMCELEHRGTRSPLREEYDRRLQTKSLLAGHMQETFRRWGIGEKDWYVCLHMRDPGFYGEAGGQGQSHRNADVESYLDTVRYITSQGGWVIKLGSPYSPSLPPLKRVIDYARSPFKCEQMDIHLIRHARYFVGTTSGLTNVAISFGVPCALVNCITVDAQLWNSRVRFALKPVVDRDGRTLTQREVTTAPWRWRLFGYDVMRRYGISPRDNSADEILATCREVENLEDGRTAPFEGQPADGAELIAKWHDSLGLPNFYGAALPSQYFLHKQGPAFLA